ILARERWLRALLGMPRPIRRAAAGAVPSDLHPRLRELLEGIARGRPSPMHMPLGLTPLQVDSLLAPRLPRSSGWATAHGADADPIATLGWDTQEYEVGLRLPELLLMRIDRFSMASSVEARVPFLDPGLVELGYRLPFDYKLHNGRGKHVLKEAVAGAVPDWIVNRPKQGFGAPVEQWLGSRFEGLLRELMA